MHRLNMSSRALVIVPVVVLLAWLRLFSDEPSTDADSNLFDRGLITFTKQAMPPIGAIIAWHKAQAPEDALPRAWMECNGKEIAYGPLAGQFVPNLNGEQRFLRGGAQSGEYQEDQVIDHSHKTEPHSHPIPFAAWSQPLNRNRPPEAHGVRNYGFPDQGKDPGGRPWPDHEVIHTTEAVTQPIHEPVQRQDGIHVRCGNETRPKNMSVVWIMRVE